MPDSNLSGQAKLCSPPWSLVGEGGTGNTILTWLQPNPVSGPSYRWEACVLGQKLHGTVPLGQYFRMQRDQHGLSKLYVQFSVAGFSPGCSVSMFYQHLCWRRFPQRENYSDGGHITILSTCTLSDTFFLLLPNHRGRRGTQTTSLEAAASWVYQALIRQCRDGVGGSTRPPWYTPSCISSQTSPPDTQRPGCNCFSMLICMSRWLVSVSGTKYF